MNSRRDLLRRLFVRRRELFLRLEAMWPPRGADAMREYFSLERTVDDLDQQIAETSVSIR